MIFRLLSKHAKRGDDEGRAIALRRLVPSDAAIFRAHLHALHFESFRDRFNGLVSDEWLDGYIDRSLKDAVVIGLFERERLIAVAELHTGGRLQDGVGECAFSVEGGHRRKGLGAILLSALLKMAEEGGIQTVMIETSPQNIAMKKLAQKVGARMELVAGQAVGRIDVAHALKKVARPGDGIAKRTMGFLSGQNRRAGIAGV